VVQRCTRTEIFIFLYIWERLVEEYVDGRYQICQRPKIIIKQLQGWQL